MTCQNGAATGDYNSYNGYTSNVCQEWMDDKITDLERKRDGAGKYGRIFEAQIQEFRQCTVQWEAPSAPLVDISTFERKPDTGYRNTETKADQTDTYVEPKADQTDAYTEPKADQTDGSYPDDSSAVKITQQTYTDDNSALVTIGNTDSDGEDTSADITEDKAVQNPY